MTSDPFPTSSDPSAFDEGFDSPSQDSLPPDPATELSLEEAAAADPGFLAVSQPEPPPLGRSPAYDYAQRAFVPNQAGSPLMLTGLATLNSWLEKCVRTVRGASPAVDPTFGLKQSLESVFLTGGMYDPTQQTTAEELIRDAFGVHPNVESVEDVTVSYTPGDTAVVIDYRVMPEGLLEAVAGSLQLDLTGGA